MTKTFKPKSASCLLFVIVPASSSVSPEATQQLHNTILICNLVHRSPEVLLFQHASAVLTMAAGAL